MKTVSSGLLHSLDQVSPSTQRGVGTVPLIDKLPVIQGTADTNGSTGKLSQAELSNTVDFCLNAFQHTDPEKTQAVMKKVAAADATNSIEAAATSVNGAGDGSEVAADMPPTKLEEKVQKKAEVDPEGLSPDELHILKTVRARQMLRTEDSMNIDNFSNDAINGYTPLISRGNLSLVKVSASSGPKPSPGLPGLFRGAGQGETPKVPMPEQQQAITAH